MKTVDMMDTNEVAKVLGVQPGSVYGMANAGTIPKAFRIGKLWRWDRAEFERWLNEKRGREEEARPESGGYVTVTLSDEEALAVAKFLEGMKNIRDFTTQMLDCGEKSIQELCRKTLRAKGVEA